MSLFLSTQVEGADPRTGVAGAERRSSQGKGAGDLGAMRRSSSGERSSSTAKRCDATLPIRGAELEHREAVRRRISAGAAALNTKDIDNQNDKFLIIFGFPWKR
jgi:hypothetical protein